MKRKIKLFATAAALQILRSIRRAACDFPPLFRVIGRLLAPFGRLLIRWIVLPIYRLGVTFRIRWNRLALPARGALLFLITNRYLLHATLGTLTLVVVFTNIRGMQARAQDIGQKSILFAIASEDHTEIIEEEVRPESPPTHVSYLSHATVNGIPHVDFDYDENADPLKPSLSVPGTITSLPLERPIERPRVPRAHTETYLVQENDTISSIAERFGVNVGTILWNNRLTERQYIRPGDKLTIPPVSGMIATVKSGDTLSKIAKRFGGDEDEIANLNALTPDARLAIGMELIIPGGRPPDIERTRTQIASHPELPPVHLPFVQTPKPADLDVRNLPAERLLWPTTTHLITQYYGWRHTGLDIEGDYTSPIYAATDGVIERAGWNASGYGLMILIDHPNGLKTRYAHASKLFVKSGDTVTRGQVIAMIGTTGRSTGTHLHFEVYTNERRRNPLSYIR